VLRNAGIVDRATDGRGRSAVWLLDNAAPPVRALVMLGRVELAPEGRYLMELPFLDQVEDARTKQTLAEIAAREVERRLGTPATYWTVLGAGKGWSDAPSYTNVSKPDERWFNCAHDKDDF
jgi:hypothetical protein